MTRQEMASELQQHADDCPDARCGICGMPDNDEHSSKPHCFEPDEESVFVLAAVELRKTCATCKDFIPRDEAKVEVDTRWNWAWCAETRHDEPADGSGFCHRWEAKLPPANTEAVTNG